MTTREMITTEADYSTYRLHQTHGISLANIPTFPSPVLTRTSTAYTSWTSNSHFSWSFLESVHHTYRRVNLTYKIIVT